MKDSPSKYRTISIMHFLGIHFPLIIPLFVSTIKCVEYLQKIYQFNNIIPMIIPIQQSLSSPVRRTGHKIPISILFTPDIYYVLHSPTNLGKEKLTVCFRGVILSNISSKPIA